MIDTNHPERYEMSTDGKTFYPVSSFSFFGPGYLVGSYLGKRTDQTFFSLGDVGKPIFGGDGCLSIRVKDTPPQPEPIPDRVMVSIHVTNGVLGAMTLENHQRVPQNPIGAITRHEYVRADLLTSAETRIRQLELRLVEIQKLCQEPEMPGQPVGE